MKGGVIDTLKQVQQMGDVSEQSSQNIPKALRVACHAKQDLKTALSLEC